MSFKVNKSHGLSLRVGVRKHFDTGKHRAHNIQVVLYVLHNFILLTFPRN